MTLRDLGYIVAVKSVNNRLTKNNKFGTTVGVVGGLAAVASIGVTAPVAVGAVLVAGALTGACGEATVKETTKKVVDSVDNAISQSKKIIMNKKPK